MNLFIYLLAAFTLQALPTHPLMAFEFTSGLLSMAQIFSFDHLQVIKIRRDRHYPRMLETHYPGRDPPGQQSVGRPGRLECRLLPDPQRHNSQ